MDEARNIMATGKQDIDAEPYAVRDRVRAELAGQLDNGIRSVAMVLDWARSSTDITKDDVAALVEARQTIEQVSTNLAERLSMPEPEQG